MADMHRTAKELAAQGRFGDDRLLHVSKEELAGIASLAPGGQLPINPTTGLPEAFFFLPFLASLFGGGAAAAAPALAATAAPALAATAAPAAAGLGGFLGSIGKGIGSLFGMGSTAAPSMAAPAMAAPAAGFAAQSTPLMTGVGTLATKAAAPGAFSAGALPGSAAAAINPATAGGIAPLAKTAAAGAVDPWLGARAVTAGANAATGGGGGGIGGLLSMKNIMPLMMGSQLLKGLMPSGGKKKEKKRDISKERYRGGDPVFPSSDYRGGIDNEHNYFPQQRYASGGIVSLAQGGMVDPRMADPQMQMPQDLSFPLNGVPSPEAPIGEIPQSPLPKSQIGEGVGGGEDDKELIAQAVAAIKGVMPNRDAILMAFVNTFGEEALKDLVAKVQGAAPSDGMSDSIPAMIDGTQPAALSEGEYVMPADVVSGLGNGSTEAGARQLDEMAGQIRTQRGGSPNQPPAMNAGGLISLMG